MLHDQIPIQAIPDGFHGVVKSLILPAVDTLAFGNKDSDTKAGQDAAFPTRPTLGVFLDQANQPAQLGAICAVAALILEPLRYVTRIRTLPSARRCQFMDHVAIVVFIFCSILSYD